MNRTSSGFLHVVRTGMQAGRPMMASNARRRGTIVGSAPLQRLGTAQHAVRHDDRHQAFVLEGVKPKKQERNIR